MRLEELKQIVEQQGYDIEELVGLLELTTEDIIERFPDRLTENSHKFGVSDNEADE